MAPAVPRPGSRRCAIIGTITPERVEILQQADAIVVEEIRRAGLYREIWQSFAVLPAVRTVGVMGDERTYAYPIIMRAVTRDDAMTADWARLPYEVLERISSRVINEVPGVNRVAYDVTSKPPAPSSGNDRERETGMNVSELSSTATALVAPGKGILAADESTRHDQEALRHDRRRVDRGDTAATTGISSSPPRASGVHQRRDPVRRDDPPERERRRAVPQGARGAGRHPRHQGRQGRSRSRSRPRARR